MRDNHIGCVLVHDSDGTLIGIVTDRDFACRLAADHAVTDVPISQIMTEDPVVATDAASLSEIVRLMESHGVRRIPITASEGAFRHKCIGIVTLDDLIAANVVDHNQLSRIVKRQIGARVMTAFPSARSGHGAQGTYAEHRSEAHARQTLNLFYKDVGDTTGLDAEVVPRITHTILGMLVRRVTYTGAAHLVSQLPSLLREPLLNVQPGPDRDITAARIVEELVLRFQYTKANATLVVEKFFEALEDYIDEGQMKHIKAQLPEDIRALFPVTAAAA